MHGDETKFLGALPDTRSDEAKLKDYHFNEVVAAAAPVVWTEKPRAEWRLFTKRFQDGSYSCVEQTVAKICEVLNFLKTGEKIPFSASNYKLRSNFPAEGMIGVNALDIARENGVPFEALQISQNQSEAQMNSAVLSPTAKAAAKLFSFGNYVQYTPKIQFEEIASTIQNTGKPVMVWFEFHADEWSLEIPTVLRPGPSLRHSVAAVDITLVQGKKALVIEDSAPFGGLSVRLVTEDFFKERNIFAAYPISFKTETTPIDAVKEKFYFAGELKLGDNSEYVKNLQRALQIEGCFPTNAATTGLYGAITAKAVLAFQKKYQLAAESELEALGGRSVGPKTRAKLNELFANS